MVTRPVAVSSRRWPCSCGEVLSLRFEGPPCVQQVSPGLPRADGLLLHAGLMCLSVKELHQGPAMSCRVLPATEQEAAVLRESQGRDCLQTGSIWLRPVLRPLLEPLCTLYS